MREAQAFLRHRHQRGKQSELMCQRSPASGNVASPGHSFGFLGAFLAGGVPSAECDPIPLDTSFLKILPSCFVSSYFALGILEWGKKTCRVLSRSQKKDQTINGV